jgi:hypothetical protein
LPDPVGRKREAGAPMSMSIKARTCLEERENQGGGEDS